VWFERGERLTGDALKRITKGMTDYLIQSLSDLGRRKPGRKSLQEHIRAALEKSPLAKDRAKLDKEAEGEGEVASDESPISNL
jgi:hypothetical protein